MPNVADLRVAKVRIFFDLGKAKERQSAALKETKALPSVNAKTCQDAIGPPPGTFGEKGDSNRIVPLKSTTKETFTKTSNSNTS